MPHQQISWLSGPWSSSRAPLAGLLTLFASVITNNAKEMPGVLRATFHAGISLFVLGYQCTMNFWACESGQAPAGEQRRRELQRMPGPWRFPADRPRSSPCLVTAGEGSLRCCSCSFLRRHWVCSQAGCGTGADENTLAGVGVVWSGSKSNQPVMCHLHHYLLWIHRPIYHLDFCFPPYPAVRLREECNPCAAV